jgi:hypothetical protein
MEKALNIEIYFMIFYGLDVQEEEKERSDLHLYFFLVLLGRAVMLNERELNQSMYKTMWMWISHGMQSCLDLTNLPCRKDRMNNIMSLTRTLAMGCYTLHVVNNWLPPPLKHVHCEVKLDVYLRYQLQIREMNHIHLFEGKPLCASCAIYFYLFQKGNLRNAIPSLVRWCNNYYDSGNGYYLSPSQHQCEFIATKMKELQSNLSQGGYSS